MTEKFIISQLYQLPEHLKVEVSHYIAFLVKKHANQVRQVRKPKKEPLEVPKANINWHLILMHR
jgi:hypothetical protein